MTAAWAQANLAAQTKLEQVKRSYNETSRGMGFTVALTHHRWVTHFG